MHCIVTYLIYSDEPGIQSWYLLSVFDIALASPSLEHHLFDTQLREFQKSSFPYED